MDEKKFPTTESQKEIWISSKMGHEASCAYNESVLLGISGVSDVDLLHRAITIVVDRHDALNSVFSNDGRWMLLRSGMEKKIDTINLSAATAREQGEAVLQQSKEAVAEAFDLENGPLWNATVLILSSRELKLFFTAHHIVCDGWSLSVLVDKILSTYSALLENKLPASYDDPSFGEYLLEQHQFAQTAQAAEHLQYWKEKFSHQVPVLQLPTDNPRPAFRTYKADCVSADVPATVSDQIKQLSISLQCNPNTIFLGVYAVLLYKLSGNPDSVVGMPVSGQSFSGKNDLVGHCINMLPVLCSINPEEPFSAFIDKLQDTLYDDFDHYTVTFGELVKELQIRREPGRIPLMSTGLTYMRMKPPDELVFPDFTATYKIIERSFETFEMQGAVVDYGDRRTFMWQYNTSLFRRETIELWLDGYMAILVNAVTLPDTPVKELSMLSAAAREELLYKWNRTARPLTQGKTVVHAIMESAERYPDAIAVEYGETSCTYRMLDVRSSLLAELLRKQGVAAGGTVAVCMDKTTDAIIAMLAILKVRAAYIPVDSIFPDERISYIMRDSGTTVLITQKEYAPKYRQLQCEMVFVDDINESSGDIADLEGGLPLPTDPAYIIYTSGSTGKPKGVKIGHEALYNFLCAMKEKPGFGRTDSVLSVTTISFDIAVLEIFLPLIAGGKVIIAEKDTVMDGSRLTQKIANCHPSVMQATPSTWTLLLNSGWKDGQGMTLLCGGEVLTRSLADRLLATGATVWNMYGPTETTVWSSLWRVEHGTQTPPVGYPIANTQLYVLDNAMEPVPAGISGELYIGGRGLALEYHNRPDLTKDKFLPDPFLEANDPSGCGKLFKTGDIAKRLGDGTIVVMGRSDFQVKIRGFRVELGEIESVLEELSAVSKAVVLATKDESGNDRLIGYIESTAEVFAEEVREYLSGKLPHYMVPDQLVQVESFPLTPNKKIDRLALVQQRQAVSLPTKVQAILPANERETKLLEIWQQVLKSTAFGTKDNFFAIGGNSILIAEIQMLIKEKLGIDIPLTSLFQYPTIASLAESLGGNGENRTDGDARERMLLKQQALNRRRNALRRGR
ncbi:MAG: amino acid adenylation domain-containing protein [Fibrobacter sp.]|nr:amino acid adenylation domain-containing protein [Fibrobacter sp.]